MTDEEKIALIRTLISDTAAGDVGQSFSDGELASILALEYGSVKRAAAQCLSVLAASEVLLSKVIKTAQGLSTNGAAVAAELRALAKEWRADADNEDAVDLIIVDANPSFYGVEYL